MEPDQVSVSLSHYCPTAAEMLFRDGGGFGLAADPGAFPRAWPFEGLDCRDDYPPLLRPGVLMGFDGLRAFEESAVAALSAGDVWAALVRIETAVEVFRAWSPAMGPLPGLIRAAFSEADSGARSSRPGLVDPRPVLSASLLKGTPGDARLPEFRSVMPVVANTVDVALRRFLAARLIAGWIAFQAEDVRTVVRYLWLCLNAVVLFEAARSRNEPERERWKESIRSADLWILHYCDPELLARNLR